MCLKRSFRKISSGFVLLAFLVNVITPPAYAQGVFNLPKPGTTLNLTAQFTPVMMRGVTLYADDPFKFDFIMDRGDTQMDESAFRDESNKLIKYFMAALTVPEKEMWVNLNPKEKDRIVGEHFGQTEMGRDLLAQDYLLKQLAASLLFQKNEERSVKQEVGLSSKNDLKNISSSPSSTSSHFSLPASNLLSRIWIIPDSATVYEHEKGAFVVKSHLKVKLEEDYVGAGSKPALQKIDQVDSKWAGLEPAPTSELLSQIETEVNNGQTFAQLRQIYNAYILATWFKKNLKQSLLGEVYVDQNKTEGIQNADPAINQKIYEQYLETFKKGATEYVKEDYDPVTQEIVPRKYFAGGAELVDVAMAASQNEARVAIKSLKEPTTVTARIAGGNIRSEIGNDSAMFVDLSEKYTEDLARILGVDQQFVEEALAKSLDHEKVKENLIAVSERFNEPIFMQVLPILMEKLQGDKVRFNRDALKREILQAIEKGRDTSLSKSIKTEDVRNKIFGAINSSILKGVNWFTFIKDVAKSSQLSKEEILKRAYFLYGHPALETGSLFYDPAELESSVGRENASLVRKSIISAYQKTKKWYQEEHGRGEFVVNLGDDFKDAFRNTMEDAMLFQLKMKEFFVSEIVYELTMKTEGVDEIKKAKFLAQEITDKVFPFFADAAMTAKPSQRQLSYDDKQWILYQMQIFTGIAPDKVVPSMIIGVGDLTTPALMGEFFSSLEEHFSISLQRLNRVDVSRWSVQDLYNAVEQADAAMTANQPHHGPERIKREKIRKDVERVRAMFVEAYPRLKKTHGFDGVSYDILAIYFGLNNMKYRDISTEDFINLGRIHIYDSVVSLREVIKKIKNQDKKAKVERAMKELQLIWRVIESDGLIFPEYPAGNNGTQINAVRVQRSDPRDHPAWRNWKLSVNPGNQIQYDLSDLGKYISIRIFNDDRVEQKKLVFWRYENGIKVLDVIENKVRIYLPGSEHVLFGVHIELTDTFVIKVSNLSRSDFYLVKPANRGKPIDFALTANSDKRNDKKTGGIDFNPAQLNMTTQKNGHGVIVPQFKGNEPRFDPNQFRPVIIQVVPAVNLLQELGLNRAWPKIESLASSQ